MPKAMGMFRAVGRTKNVEIPGLGFGVQQINRPWQRGVPDTMRQRSDGTYEPRDVVRGGFGDNKWESAPDNQVREVWAANMRVEDGLPPFGPSWRDYKKEENYGR